MNTSEDMDEYATKADAADEAMEDTDEAMEDTDEAMEDTADTADTDAAPYVPRALPQTKHCPRCDTTKPATAFYVTTQRGAYRLSGYCRYCHRTYQRSRYATVREQAAETAVDSRRPGRGRYPTGPTVLEAQ